MRWHHVFEAEEIGYMSATGFLDGQDPWHFEMCQERPAPKVAWLKAIPESDGTPDDVLANHYGLLVFSARLRRAIVDARLQVNVQYVPIQVLHADGAVAGDYAIANILDLVDAFDLSASVFESFEADYFLPGRRGQIRSMTIPVLRPDALEGRDLIRPLGFSVQVYCSEDFKRVFQEGGHTGIQFHEVAVQRTRG